jgi:hypothetical protein
MWEHIIVVFSFDALFGMTAPTLVPWGRQSTIADRECAESTTQLFKELSSLSFNKKHRTQGIWSSLRHLSLINVAIIDARMVFVVR